MKFILTGIGVNLLGVMGVACVRIKQLYMSGILPAGSLYRLVAARLPGLGGL